MSRGKDDGYKCTLSPEALKKSMEELNEIPENRLLEVKTLRLRLDKVPGLKPRTDTTFLLAFLRGCCFDQEKTFLQITNFYQIIKDKPEIFEDVKPSRVGYVVEERMFDVLKERDNNGCKVIVFRAKMWNPDIVPLDDVMKLYYIFTMQLIQDEDNQVFGVRVINDSGGISMKQITAITPMQCKMMINLAFYSFPLHIRRCDYVHENKLFGVFFALFSPFIDAELHKKLGFYGSKVELLHDSMNPEFIPNDIGGKAEPYSNQEWFDALMDTDKWHEENNKFGYLTMGLENTKKESNKENAGMQGLGGSFKKLEI